MGRWRRVTLKKSAACDAREGQGGTGRSDDELQALWGADPAPQRRPQRASVQDYLQHTIAPLDQQINRDYRAYWDLMALGSVSTARSRCQGGLGLLRAQAAAGLA